MDTLTSSKLKTLALQKSGESKADYRLGANIYA